MPPEPGRSLPLRRRVRDEESRRTLDGPVQPRAVPGPPCRLNRPDGAQRAVGDSVGQATLEVSGGRVAYELRGHGPAIVLLHEGIADRRMWNREFSTLANEFRTARYDLRGYGSSPAATSEFSPVQDLLTLLDHFQMTRPLIVGPSVGGKIALDFALEHPDHVGGLLLVAPGYSGMDYDHVPGGKSAFERDERLSKAAADAWAARDLDSATEHLRQLWASALSGEGLELFRTMVRDNAKEIFEEQSGRFETRSGGPAAGRLGEIRVPTRILVGDRDNPVMPLCANFLARGIANAQVELVPGADHLLNLSQPAAFDSAIRRFLQQLPNPPG